MCQCRQDIERCTLINKKKYRYNFKMMIQFDENFDENEKKERKKKRKKLNFLISVFIMRVYVYR